MKTLAAIVTTGLFMAFLAAPVAAQVEGKKKEGAPQGGEKKGPPPKEGEKKGPPAKEVEKKGPAAKEGDKPGKCGKDAAGYLDALRKRGEGKPEELDKAAREHFRKHSDGVCHCFCGHEEGQKEPPAKVGPKEGDGEKKPPPKCGRDAGGFQEELKRRGYGKDEGEKTTKEHFKSHPDGCCHCFCGHDDAGGKEGGPKDVGKGNNGVGNGQDPPPPGKPPVNDGPGTGPGNPGNKKGGDGKK